MYQFSVSADKVVIGACTPLSTIQHEADEAGKDITLARTVLPMRDMLRWFASTQIRNVACLGGNLVTASPISDMNPMLASMGATLTLSQIGQDGIIVRRTKPVSEFFLQYRKVDIGKTEIVEKIEVPLLARVFEYVQPFKQARRREDDISIVTSGMRIRLSPSEADYKIEDVVIAFGGMAPKTVLAPKTMEFLVGKTFSKATFTEAQEVILGEFKLPEGVPGGQAAYRMSLAASFLYKFFVSSLAELKQDIDKIKTNPSLFASLSAPLPEAPDLDTKEESAADNFLRAPKPSFSGSQAFPAPKAAKGLEEEILQSVDSVKEGSKTGAGAVGKGSVHQSGALHCTGEAIYTDDVPLPPGTLQAALILATKSGVTFEGLGLESVLKIPGIVDVCTATDISTLGGKNELGPIVHDETVFLPVGETIGHVGQVLGIVVGETLECAEMAVHATEIKYGGGDAKVIVTIEEAIQHGSFFENTRHKLTRGDPSFMDKLREEAKADSTSEGELVTVSGFFHSGAQEHFYLETNSTLVVPSDGATNLTIYCSTQAPTKTQKFCASSTGTPAAKVVCRVKRLGGGFGGKETRSVFASCAASVAAKKLNRPVRITLARNVDMLTTGHRHAFVSKYIASARKSDGGAKLVSMDVEVYNNGGSALDLSGPVADRALFHIDNVYLFPNLRVEAVSCKTAQAPHTAYRGFGGPQGMVVTEHVLEHLAVACGVHIDKMRRDNIYKDGESTHFGMVLGEGGTNGKWNVPKMFDRLYSKLDVRKRRVEIEEFNANNRWLKRGCAMLPTKFGVAFTAKYMNQGRYCIFWNYPVNKCPHHVSPPMERRRVGTSLYGWYCSCVTWWHGDGPGFAYQGLSSCSTNLWNSCRECLRERQQH